MPDTPKTEVTQADDIAAFLRAENAEPGDWYALFPIILLDQDKRTLEAIVAHGGYETGSEPALNIDTLSRLQREFRFIHGRRRTRNGPTVYAVTDAGKFWLAHCRQIGGGK
jgi:hypothetical protein